jgi:hypothetical protein
MTNGFFWRVPGKKYHYIYTNVEAQNFLEVDFMSAPSLSALRSWDLVSSMDKLTLQLIRTEEQAKAETAHDSPHDPGY